MIGNTESSDSNTKDQSIQFLSLIQVWVTETEAFLQLLPPHPVGLRAPLYLPSGAWQSCWQSWCQIDVTSTVSASCATLHLLSWGIVLQPLPGAVLMQKFRDEQTLQWGMLQQFEKNPNNVFASSFDFSCYPRTDVSRVSPRAFQRA